MKRVISEKELRVVSEAVEIVKQSMALDMTKDRRSEIAALHMCLLEMQAAVSEHEPVFNHLFSLGFSVISTCKTGESVDPETIRQGIRQRLEELGDDQELLEAVGLPIDTYRIGESQ